jgi:hypothetical protein
MMTAGLNCLMRSFCNLKSLPSFNFYSNAYTTMRELLKKDLTLFSFSQVPSYARQGSTLILNDLEFSEKALPFTSN